MEVKQIYELVNSTTKEILGESAVVNEDLSNLADVGTSIFNATSTDNYVKALCDHIGKVIFTNRTYSGSVPSVIMDGWEYGAVLQKVTADIPQASENSDWNLVNGQSYDVNIFYKPTVSNKFFNKRVTFEIPMSVTDIQVKSAFSNVEQMNGFVSMIMNSIEKSMTVKLDSLVMRTINNMTAQTVYNAFGENAENVYSDKDSIRAVNLLKQYNDKFGTQLTADKALTDPAFIRFATYTISLYKDRLSKISTLFNIGGKERFTDDSALRIVLLSDFKASATAYLESDTFHNDLVKLPNSESVPYWQGSGKSYGFADVSSIDVKTQNPTADGTVDVKLSGIIGVMFDRDSLGVANLDRRVTTNYNAKAEFTNFYTKATAGYFNDTNENFIVFFVA